VAAVAALEPLSPGQFPRLPRALFPVKGQGAFLRRWRDLDERLHEKFVADKALQGDAGGAICASLAAENLTRDGGEGGLTVQF
jgi:hypothetical protein